MSTDSSSEKKRTLGVIGVIVGFVALSCAFLSPWIQEAIDPPKKTLEESTVDFAGRLAEAAKAKVKGEEYVAANTEQPKPSRFIFPTVIGMGLVGAGLGIGSMLKSEQRMIGGGAIALGIGAVVVQWSIIIASAIFFLVLVLAVMALFGGGL